MSEFERDYEEQILGRPMVFLLPSDLMGIKINDKTCREIVEQFLSSEYGGYTDEGSGHSGFWKSDAGTHYAGKYQKYRVSFNGKERILQLKKFLSFLAHELGKKASIWKPAKMRGSFIRKNKISCLH